MGVKEVCLEQAAFVACQHQGEDMKKKASGQITDMDKELEAQEAKLHIAQTRDICTEDLVHFYECQRREVHNHGEAACAEKDDSIRSLKMEVTKYNIDWKQLSMQQRMTDASLTHWHHCLLDRHETLLSETQRSPLQPLIAQLREKHASLQTEVDDLRTARTKAESRWCKQAEECGSEVGTPSGPLPSQVIQFELKSVGLRSELEALGRWREEQDANALERVNALQSHKCIWRDQLNVREPQLNRMTAHTDKIINALLITREEIDDATRKNKQEEGMIRDYENEYTRWLEECHTLRRTEAELRRYRSGHRADLSVLRESISSPQLVAAKESPNTVIMDL